MIITRSSSKYARAISPTRTPSRYLFQENAVARARRRLVVRVPERRVVSSAAIYVAFETRSTGTVRKRVRPPAAVTVRRFPPHCLVVANRPPIAVAAAKIATAKSATGGVITAVAKIAVIVVANAVIVVVCTVAAITIASGTQSTADEREQLLYVPVELVGGQIRSTSDDAAIGAAAAAAVIRRGRARRTDVSPDISQPPPPPPLPQHVRLEVHRLGMPLMVLLLSIVMM